MSLKKFKNKKNFDDETIYSNNDMDYTKKRKINYSRLNVMDFDEELENFEIKIKSKGH